MIRSATVSAVVLICLATRAGAQDRALDEAQAAGERAAQAAADALRAAQTTEIPEAPPSEEPVEPVSWIAQPVVQAVPQSVPAPPQAPDFPRIEIAKSAEETPVDPAPAVEQRETRTAQAAMEPALPEPTPDAVVQAVAAAPRIDVLPYAPTLDQTRSRPVRRATRLVVLPAYSPEQRAAWLTQCSAIYRGSYDCDGYLLRYEQSAAAALRGQFEEGSAPAGTWVRVPTANRRPGDRLDPPQG